MMSFRLHDRALGRLYARGPSSIAFVDEAYRADRKPPFYITSAVVVPFDLLESLRDDLLDAVGSDYWHTAEAFQRDADPSLRDVLTDLVDRLAEDDAISLCSIDTEEAHFRNLEQVRSFTLVSLATLLVEQHNVELMVYERRRAGAEEHNDFATERRIQADPKLRNLRLHGGTPSSEPLLWMPDVVASTLRRRLAFDDREWFEPLRTKTKIHRAGTHEQIPLGA